MMRPFLGLLNPVVYCRFILTLFPGRSRFTT